MNDVLARAVAERIARYLHENRTAADTIEGVHYVWVGTDMMQGSLDLTQAALEYLRERGIVACVPIGNRLLWRSRAR
jgi:hypothetical protein